MRRKNCAICSSAIPVNTASSASSRSEIMKIMPTQRVDRPAITAIIPSLLSKKANTTHTIPDPRARYRGMSYRTCALVASLRGPFLSLRVPSRNHKQGLVWFLKAELGYRRYLKDDSIDQQFSS